ncbi:MAG: hypothetical protein WEB59_14615 [Thermoanaerobaculia bacterium]
MKTSRAGSARPWDYVPNFGKPTGAASHQQPRTFRLEVGLRF